MLNAEGRSCVYQVGGSSRPRRHGGLTGPEPPSAATAGAVASSRSLAALKVTRKYRQAAVRRREYRKLKAIVPAVCTKHTVSKVRIITIIVNIITMNELIFYGGVNSKDCKDTAQERRDVSHGEIKVSCATD